GHAAHGAEGAVVDLHVLAVEHDRRLVELRGRPGGERAEGHELSAAWGRLGGERGCGTDHGILLGHDYLLSARREVNTRAIRVTMKVMRTSVSAAPHARSWAAVKA